MSQFFIRLTGFIIVSLCFTTLVSAQNTFDVISYDAQIEPDMATKSVTGKVRIQFISLQNNLKVIYLNSGALEIETVSDDKSRLNFEKKDALLKINLSNPAMINEQREIEILYHGAPPFGLKFSPAQNQIYTIFSTSQWLPCVDAPDDRATFRFNLITHKNNKVVGNGRFVKQINLPDNRISSVWEQQKPIPTYTFGFAVGRFREVVQNYRGRKLRFLVSPDFSASHVKQIFRDTGEMLDFYENKAGVRYSDKTYTQVLTADDSEQEMSSFAIMNADYGRGVLADKKDIWLGAHEFAHQWWGNMVTNGNWTHFWLNEGVATFMTAAYLEHRFGRAEYLAQIDDYRVRYEKVREAGKDKPLVFPDWNKPTREDRVLVYRKGAYVIYLLREELGDAAFWKGLQNYTRQFWGKSVATTDFQKAMEKSSGRDLSEFFQKWVYRAKS